MSLSKNRFHALLEEKDARDRESDEREQEQYEASQDAALARDYKRDAE